MIITTSLGDMDDSLLEKSEGELDNENEHTSWIEYRLQGIAPPRIENGICLDCRDGVCRHIHRSVRIDLKKGVLAEGSAGSFQ